MDVVEQNLIIEGAELYWGVCKETCTIPRQRNFNDCGVFNCINGRNIAEKSDHKFHLNISRTRQHIKNELLCSKLLTVQTYDHINVHL